jgi:hypothetical protein
MGYRMYGTELVSFVCVLIRDQVKVKKLALKMQRSMVPVRYRSYLKHQSKFFIYTYYSKLEIVTVTSYIYDLLMVGIWSISSVI